MVALETFNVEFKVVPRSTSKVESIVVAPPTERAVFKETSFWTSKVEANVVALVTSKVEFIVVPRSTCNVESMVTAPPTDRALLNEASF